ncbi:hypothetical protein M0R45_023846 [Rubus argutus]|uniref:Uncharacterized protein n=1 Tax=Rubus argutus TaxID=59490 RepID=A0AAW1WNY2_RUBAR
MDSWLLMMLAFVAVVPPAIFQALSGSGRAEPALSVSGRAAPALSGSGRNRRLLMTDYSKPTHAPPPAPSPSPNNPICMNCSPQSWFDYLMNYTLGQQFMQMGLLGEGARAGARA